jgi:hypothetical protein
MTTKKNEYILKGILETDKYNYKIKITTSQITKDGINIIYSRYFNIGAYVSETGEKKTCVDIYVMYPEFKKEIPSINYKLAKLTTTHYNEKCSVNEKLERGEGTQHMINTAMYFVSKMCPFIEGFDINDTFVELQSLDLAFSKGDISTRQCDNDTTITLSYFSITKYGKTWYEKNFNAYIADGIKRKKYENIISELLLRELPSWDIFNALFLRNVNKDIKELLKKIHEDSTTYKSLFKNIHNEGISKACIYLQPWIENVMLSTDLRNYVMYTQWIIPVESVKRVGLVNYKREFVGRLENYENK